MRPFTFQFADSPAAAVRATATPATTATDGSGGVPANAATAQFLAGGTTILDLMKLDVMRPGHLVDINPLAGQLNAITLDDTGLRMGALARMADVADHPGINRAYPMLAQSMLLAASAQLRNMASLGGNVLQRTRCMYFRDNRWSACNKRAPGSGCAARDGVNRDLAVLGVSDHCIASYPGDWAVAMVALDASVDILSPAGQRTIRFGDLHRLPGDTPHIETVLRPGELITGFTVPALPWARRSLYLKVRDRQSYQFALASAAVALELDGRIVRDARIGLGGIAAKPWRSRAAEAALRGQTLNAQTADAAGQAAVAGAWLGGRNAFKAELARRTLARTLLAAGQMEV
jgi:xanthine dehydrogenase YagS FAD-binding subunit